MAYDYIQRGIQIREEDVMGMRALCKKFNVPRTELVPPLIEHLAAEVNLPDHPYEIRRKKYELFLPPETSELIDKLAKFLDVKKCVVLEMAVRGPLSKNFDMRGIRESLQVDESPTTQEV